MEHRTEWNNLSSWNRTENNGIFIFQNSKAMWECKWGSARNNYRHTVFNFGLSLSFNVNGIIHVLFCVPILARFFSCSVNFTAHAVSILFNFLDFSKTISPFLMSILFWVLESFSNVYQHPCTITRFRNNLQTLNWIPEVCQQVRRCHSETSVQWYHTGCTAHLCWSVQSEKKNTLKFKFYVFTTIKVQVITAYQRLW